MVEQVPFINREEELGQIEVLIREWGTQRVLCIQAPGGIGKTRLLQEVHKRYVNKSDNLFVADILDFDNRALHIRENIGLAIVNQIDKEPFDSYLRGLQDYRKMEMAGVSPERLAQEKQSVHQAFVNDFNEFSDKRRVVLLLDTMDALTETSILDYIATNLALRLKNTSFLIAGRNAKNIWGMLQPKLGESVQFVELVPLEPEASESYLQQKQNLLHTALEPELAQKLLLLAQGRPILIDLAVEWIARDVPLDWLVESSLDEFESLADEEMKWRQKELEAHLVHHITQVRTQMDRLTLVMSHVYPLNVEMIVELLKIPEDEARGLFEEAQIYTFVKSLPDGRISLHDEMRRMVNGYVWPEVDPDGDRKRRDSRLATVYFEREIRDLKARIDQFKERDLERIGVAQELADMERSYWFMQADRVRYALRADWSEGISIFAEAFDEATLHYQSDIRGLLLNLVKENLEEAIKRKWHDRDARYKYDIRLVQQRLDTLGDLKETHLILESLKADYLEQDRQVDILTRLANCARLSANLQEAVGYLGQALAICEAEPEIMEVWGGTILNTMGWMHRLLGKWEEAARYYRQSIDLIREAGNEAKLAAAYNNLGYTIGLQKSYDSALVYGHRALAIQESLGLKYDSGRTHNALGIIHRGKENYLASLEHTNKALSIFQEFEDEEWISKAYCERGITRWHMGELQEAETDLERSYQNYKETGLRFELVNILHGRGHVAWELGKIGEAEQYFRESAEVGRQVLDFRQTVNSLEGLVELYYDVGYGYHRQGAIEKRDKWYAKAEEMAVQWKEEFEDNGYYFPLYSGSRLRILGNIAYDHEDYDTALQRYLEAYPRIASPWGYSKYMLPEALDWLQERIDQLSPQLALEWCNRIQEYWETNSLDRDFPEMISVCEIGRDNARRRVASQGGDDHE
jgi:tetratricopeptide (TPR) repeat protein